MTSVWTKRIALLGVLLISIAVLRFTLPVRIEGDWTGSLTKCLCNYRNLMRFDHGHVTFYGHGGEASKLADWGTYRQVGPNTYEWLSPKHSPTTVKVGWFFSSYQGGFLEKNEILYCWRYPFPWRAAKLYRQCDQFTAARKQQ